MISLYMGISQGLLSFEPALVFEAHQLLVVVAGGLLLFRPSFKWVFVLRLVVLLVVLLDILLDILLVFRVFVVGCFLFWIVFRRLVKLSPFKGLVIRTLAVCVQSIRPTQCVDFATHVIPIQPAGVLSSKSLPKHLPLQGRSPVLEGLLIVELLELPVGITVNRWRRCLFLCFLCLLGCGHVDFG